MSVSSSGGSVKNVKLGLTTSPSSLKPKFTSGCSKEGTNSCSMGTVSSTQQKHTLRAQVPVATTTSVKSVKLTVKASGTDVDPGPTAWAPIGVTAPKPSSTPASSKSASSSPTAGKAGAGGGPGPSAPGVGALTPGGVRSTLGVGGLPFVSSTGARAGLQPSLSPGGNASSLFPTLKPSSGSSGQGSPSRIRPVADSLPGDASLMDAQYAGLAALAVAFLLSVTRLSVRRRRSSPRPGA